MTYEELLNISETENLIVKEKEYSGIRRTNIQEPNRHPPRNRHVHRKACVLAEELGHYYTTVGDILDQSKPENRKQERQARLWAYNKQIGLIGLVRAFEHGCQNRFEIAEYLEVTEEFLEECIECYRNKYGICKRVDNYVVYFTPYLAIIKII